MKKTVLVTGASRGIGRALALEFARNNYNVIGTYVSDSSEEKIKELKKEIINLNNVEESFRYYKCNHSNFSDNQLLIEKLKSQDITVNVLINNAGVSIIGLAQDLTESQWNHIWNTNVTSVVSLCKAVIPDMLKTGGCIINISSVWGNVGASCETAYSATKGAVNSYTRALAKELAPSRIPVNAIACGMVETEMNSHLSQLEKDKLVEEIPIGRIAKPSEVAALALLISQSPDYLTSQIITIDGGWI
ncbi:MAG: SDR family oxidoreductase [Lachnospiraceae bacterium]|nr:SDR family oxidoreductase [Lachnospiraceae bacterium]